ncbi:MAG: hypothetical protein ACO1TE_16865 [Prosthecobacter sp.]
MKSIAKYSSIAAAMLLAQQASAVDIVVTGSTAFRSATHTAIQNMMTGETVVHNHASALNSAGVATFKGSIAGITETVYVYCSWSGSATGIAAVANSTLVPVIDAAATDAAPQGVVTPGIASNSTKLPRMAFSDVYKESTIYASAALTDQRMAVIPFRFVRNRLSSSLITNVTAQQVRALWNNNQQPLKLWTGNAADQDIVIPVGRDNGSGTRITVLAETKYGVGNPVQQWNMTTTGSAGTGSVVSARIWPVGLGVGSTLPGNGGYSSGGDIAPFMGMESSSIDLLDENGDEIVADVPVTILGYLGLGDTTTATNNGAVALTYEGVAYSANAVYEGNYTLWGYLHFYYPTLTTDETSFRTAMATQLANGTVLGSNGLLLSAMHCARTSDGGVVTP